MPTHMCQLIHWPPSHCAKGSVWSAAPASPKPCSQSWAQTLQCFPFLHSFGSTATQSLLTSSFGLFLMKPNLLWRRRFLSRALMEFVKGAPQMRCTQWRPECQRQPASLSPFSFVRVCPGARGISMPFRERWCCHTVSFLNWNTQSSSTPTPPRAPAHSVPPCFFGPRVSCISISLETVRHFATVNSDRFHKLSFCSCPRGRGTAHHLLIPRRAPP